MFYVKHENDTRSKFPAHYFFRWCRRSTFLHSTSYFQHRSKNNDFINNVEQSSNYLNCRVYEVKKLLMLTKLLEKIICQKWTCLKFQQNSIEYDESVVYQVCEWRETSIDFRHQTNYYTFLQCDKEWVEFNFFYTYEPIISSIADRIVNNAEAIWNHL